MTGGHCLAVQNRRLPEESEKKETEEGSKGLRDPRKRGSFSQLGGMKPSEESTFCPTSGEKVPILKTFKKFSFPSPPYGVELPVHSRSKLPTLYADFDSTI